MKTYFSEIIPKLKSKSEELDVTAILTSTHWIMVRDDEEKQTYIFRDNNDLLISRNGNVQKAKWEYLGNKSVLIDSEGGSYLFKLSSYLKGTIALKLDNKQEYAMFFSDDLTGKELMSVKDFEQYLKNELNIINESKIEARNQKVKQREISDPTIVSESEPKKIDKKSNRSWSRLAIFMLVIFVAYLLIITVILITK